MSQGASQPPAVLRTIDLTKRFGEVLALDRLNLTVERGEVVGLLGPNGAGKTTTINLVLGLLTPTSGRVELFGLDVGRHRSEALRRVNFASAYAGLPRDLTLRENLAVFADLYEVPRPRERIERVIDELGLHDLANRPTLQLSAGQRMRAVLAKALLSEPELLLLDEPTASLDPDTAVTIREYLVGLARRGVTLLWASHNMVEIERYATRVVFLHSGRVVMDGPPRELAERAGRVLLRLKPAGPLPDELRARLRQDGDGWHQAETLDTAAAAELVATVQATTRLEGLELRQPSLEDLFIQLARERGLGPALETSPAPAADQP